MTNKIRFPDGREVDIQDVIAFLYGLSRSDVEVLHTLTCKGSKMSTEELAEALKVTKASISKSINNLLYKGLINREKVTEDEKRKGRPAYMYWVNRDDLYDRVIADMEKLAETMKNDFKNHVQLAVIPA
ncbi:MarR family transcriptional regulator [Metallosphaera hakonensis]|uniref:TrmB family transcriptional regulator n=1 Tax=Metallosphaera hakonensis JCM 8857 = DSM 7519 TaxID=1293036 RepID=A0A2U9IX97_9CREN|nr:MarR family transcriptional regulator [Metallosphaera hakonensis]AWS00721.1 MarR family transcriptional regulator [Metallosphaera hakonensis JCM 8857 = DSM 7519]